MAVIGTTFDGRKIGIILAHRGDAGRGESQPTILFVDPAARNLEECSSADLNLIQRGALCLDTQPRANPLQPISFFDGRDHYLVGSNVAGTENGVYVVPDARGVGN